MVERHTLRLAPARRNDRTAPAPALEGRVGDLEQLLQVPWLPHQTVRVVGDGVAEVALPSLSQQLVPPRPPALAHPRRTAVVDVDMGGVYYEAPSLGDLAADPLLAVDTCLVVVVRLGYSAVDRRRFPGRVWCARNGPFTSHGNERMNMGWPERSRLPS